MTSRKEGVWGGGGDITYGERAQLSGATLAEDGEDLGHLARNAESAGAGLEIGEGAHVDEGGGEEGGEGSGEGGDEEGGGALAAAVVEDEDGDNNVLGEDQGGLAVGAEGEAAAERVGQGDEVGGALEQVRQEADALRRPRPRQLQRRPTRRP